MISREFLPSVIADTDQFYKQRTSILMKRSLIGLSLAAICTGAMIGMLHSSNILSWWYVPMVCVAMYIFPLWTALSYLKSPSSELEEQKAVVNRLWHQVLLVVASWVIAVLFILPTLNPELRIVAICLYIAVVFAHFAPFSLFPRLALIICMFNLLPPSLALTLLDDAEILPLGLTGIVLSFMEIAVITWVFRADMSSLAERKRISLKKEPDLSNEGLNRRKVGHLYMQCTQSIILQAVLAFGLVILLRTPETEMLMWCWFLAYVSLQTWRASGIVSYQSDSERHSLRRWRVQFGIGVVLNQVVWYMLPILFFDVFLDIGFGAASGIFFVVAILSILGLTVDRALLYLNCVMSIIPPIVISLMTANVWSIISLGLVVLFTSFVVIESIHRAAVKSLMSRLLQQLSEFRELQMRDLNADLSVARQRLTEVNSSLESQVQERTQELNHQASHDMLTGLGNRYYFSHVVENALQNQREGDPGFAIYLLDLDRFKEINDGLGHLAGDQVLREAAHRIGLVCGDTNACARWGGDEFVILQKNVSTEEGVQEFASQIVSQMQKPITLDSGQVIIGASIGVALCPDHGTMTEQLLEHADIAVYRAKTMKESVAIYDADWGVQAADRHQLAQALRVAIENESIDLALQPFIGASDGHVVGFEALARWTQADGTSVSPELFIPLAEECGLMPMLGRWVLRRACETLQEVSADSDLRVAVNISVVQLLDVEFYNEVMETLAVTGLHPQRLELEMTESVLAGDVERIRTTLHKLRQQGIRISIDDFGTGYSSISYLRDFPLDTLKIDRSFVVALDQAGEGIFSSIVALAHGLGLSIIVEGVETRSQLDSVLRLGGEEIQGYFFSKPVPRDDVSLWLADHLNSPFNMKRRYLSVRSG
jgi:diguanylate cyclase (GGDEF)-like protein